MTLPTWFPELKDVVLFALALWGAALSTVNWWKTGRRDQRLIKVDLGSGMANVGPMSGRAFAHFKVTNVGHRAVTVASIWLEIPKGKRMFSTSILNMPGMVDTPLPATLSDGQSAHLWMSYQSIGHAVADQGIESATLCAVCEDSSGKTHRSGSWAVNAAEFIDM
ncbi:MAG: hypothetical protein EOS03_13670 [Mesorhizobium sp.]|uniref:hypothetical protein n=1 Tax=Mesorhizobium sp. TaxID=1871066 RepID=UPI000FEA4CBB|nr:hypothetical protein [Mesorhizobium sp.]RWN47388.1 MAG: hypothetical protein EOS03_13670 [Mesorhizobium sp.]